MGYPQRAPERAEQRSSGGGVPGGAGDCYRRDGAPVPETSGSPVGNRQCAELPASLPKGGHSSVGLGQAAVTVTALATAPGACTVAEHRRSCRAGALGRNRPVLSRKATMVVRQVGRSEEHTSELQSLRHLV